MASHSYAGHRLTTGEVLREGIDAVRTDPRMVLVTLVGGLLSAIPVLGNVFVTFTNGIAVAIGYRTIREDHRAPTDVLTRLVYLFVALLVTAVLVGIGLVFLVLPGIYLALRFTLHPAAVMVDGHGPLAALSESWNRSEGHLLTILGFGVVLFVPALVLVFVLAFALSGGQLSETVGTLTFGLLAGVVGAPFSAVHAGGVAVMYDAFED